MNFFLEKKAFSRKKLFPRYLPVLHPEFIDAFLPVFYPYRALFPLSASEDLKKIGTEYRRDFQSCINGFAKVVIKTDYGSGIYSVRFVNGFTRIVFVPGISQSTAVGKTSFQSVMDFLA